MWFLTPSTYFLPHPTSSNRFDRSPSHLHERPMYPIFFTLGALLSLAAVHATDLSGCTFDCPTEDLANFPLGEHSDDGVTLFCSYPASPTGGAGDFSCRYDVSLSYDIICSSTKILQQNTGALSQDGNAGFCPKAAISSCPEADHNSPPPQSSAIPTTTPVAHAPIFDEL